MAELKAKGLHRTRTSDRLHNRNRPLQKAAATLADRAKQGGYSWGAPTCAMRLSAE